MEVDMTMACFRILVGRASCLKYTVQEGNQKDLKEEDVIVVTKTPNQNKDLVDSVSFVLESQGIIIQTLDGRQLTA